MQHFEDERDTKRKKKEEKLSDQTLTETECNTWGRTRHEKKKKNEDIEEENKEKCWEKEENQNRPTTK